MSDPSGVLDLIQQYLTERVRVLRAESAFGPEVIFYGARADNSPLIPFAEFVAGFLETASIEDLPTIISAYETCLRGRVLPVEFCDLMNSLRVFRVWAEGRGHLSPTVARELDSTDAGSQSGTDGAILSFDFNRRTDE